MGGGVDQRPAPATGGQAVTKRRPSGAQAARDGRNATGTRAGWNRTKYERGTLHNTHTCMQLPDFAEPGSSPGVVRWDGPCSFYPCGRPSHFRIPQRSHAAGMPPASRSAATWPAAASGSLDRLPAHVMLAPLERPVKAEIYKSPASCRGIASPHALGITPWHGAPPRRVSALGTSNPLLHREPACATYLGGHNGHPPRPRFEGRTRSWSKRRLRAQVVRLASCGAPIPSSHDSQESPHVATRRDAGRAGVRPAQDKQGPLAHTHTHKNSPRPHPDGRGPKSHNFTVARGPKHKKLSGFTSRWMMPTSCNVARPAIARAAVP